MKDCSRIRGLGTKFYKNSLGSWSVPPKYSTSRASSSRSSTSSSHRSLRRTHQRVISNNSSSRSWSIPKKASVKPPQIRTSATKMILIRARSPNWMTICRPNLTLSSSVRWIGAPSWRSTRSLSVVSSSASLRRQSWTSRWTRLKMRRRTTRNSSVLRV